MTSRLLNSVGSAAVSSCKTRWEEAQLGAPVTIVKRHKNEGGVAAPSVE